MTDERETDRADERARGAPPAARLLIAFGNTIDGDDHPDRLESAAGLDAWLDEQGLLGSPSATDDDLRVARDLRRGVRAACLAQVGARPSVEDLFRGREALLRLPLVATLLPTYYAAMAAAEARAAGTSARTAGTGPAGAGEAAEPVGRVRLAEPGESAGPVDPSEPAERAGPAASAERAGPAERAERAGPDELPERVGTTWRVGTAEPAERPALAPAAGDPVTRALSEIAAALVHVSSTGEINRLKQCPNVQCGVLYWDRTRSRTRRWCTMRTCGNRAKARRYAARRKLTHI